MTRRKTTTPTSDRSPSSPSPHQHPDSDHVGRKRVSRDTTCHGKGEWGKQAEEDKFRRLFGFRLKDVSTWGRLVRLLCRPADPAALGVLRFFYGLLMVLDTFQERGLGMLDARWGNTEECRFPLFNFLQPLPLQWMYAVYLVMLMGAVGIMLGFMFRVSCLLYLGPYWYIFFLDKVAWNNHSYLFGILAFLFSISDANRYWSLDAFFNPKIRNAHVPLWNYTLFRSQLFLVYFLAGLKKLDIDWVSGYSMQNLSHHWVFDPFKFVLTDSQIDLYIVHLGGLTIDLFIGYLLFFDKTRPLGLVISSSFNLMNSQIFSIGMFSWAMLACQTVFCYSNWPRSVFRLIPPAFRLLTPEDEEFELSPHCIYSKEDVKSENEDHAPSFVPSRHLAVPPSTPNWKHKTVAACALIFISWQCLLPYSHGITKGYNNWTNGLYGYSWDMMVHSWTVQHIRITYRDKDTGQSGYLDPMVWVGGNRRWSSHADMLKQYAACISKNLRSYDINNVEIYFDIWRSLNHRFQQRMVNPHVDMLTAEWSPVQETPWMLPLLADLSDWRKQMEDIQKSLDNSSDTHTDVVFVADFPGLYLENYVQPDFGNTSLSVLRGRVTVELVDENKNISLSPGDSVQIPADTFHNVHTMSDTPSCYMYLFVNTTEAYFMKRYTKFEEDVNKSSSVNQTLKKYSLDPYRDQYYQVWAAKQVEQLKEEQSLWSQFKGFLRVKYNLLRRSLRMTAGAVYCLATNSSFDEFLNRTYTAETQADRESAKV